MPDYGFKVGSNLNTDDDKDLPFTSKYSALKIYKWGDAQFTTDGSGTGAVNITHDLGYTPIVAVFKKFTAQYTFLSATTYPNAYRLVNSENSYDVSGFFQYADDSKIRIYTQAIGGGGGTSPSPNTTYYFRYMIFVDLSQSFSSGSTIGITGDFGFKASKPGKNVFSSEEYDMEYSSKYKALQFYDNHILSSSLTLPAMFASRYDTEVEEATYVDFNHNLGYAPFFLVYSDLASAYLYEVPFLQVEPYALSYEGVSEVSAWCDSSRVRVLFRRLSKVNSGATYGESYSSTTISIKVIIFAESLTGTAS